MIILKKRDALDTLKAVQTKSVDLVLLDPYYNEWGEWIEKGLLEESFRVLKDEGNLICFTQQPFDFDLRVALQDNFRREIIWHIPKRPKWVSNNMPLVSHQKIYWATKTSEHFFQPRTGLPYSEHTQVGEKGSMVFRGYREKANKFEKHPEGIWLHDVLSMDKPHQPDKEGGKPIELIEVLIKCFSPEVGTVVDPFVGCGTTVHACNSFKRTCIAGDVDDSPFESIEEELHSVDIMRALLE